MKVIRAAIIIIVTGLFISACNNDDTEEQVAIVPVDSPEVAFTDMEVLDRMSMAATTDNGQDGCKGFIKGKGRSASCAGIEIAEITDAGQILYKGQKIGQWEDRLVLTFTEDSFKLQTYSSPEEFAEIYSAALD